MCIQYVYQCLSDGLQAWWFFKKIIKMLTNNIQNNVKADQKEIKKTKQNALYANKIGTRQIHVKEINTDHEGHRTLFFRRNRGRTEGQAAA